MSNMRIRFAGLMMLAGVIVVAGLARADGGGNNLLQRDVETLSSESFEGRGVGTDGLERSLEYLEKRFQEAGLRPFGVDGYRQSFAGPDGVTLVNLIGVLGDPDGDQHVIVGAHYDHLGLGEPGDANHGTLHPGADDNASGVAVLLECARRLAAEGELTHPVVFIAFSGEEKGLLGSAHYVDHPVKPLSGCVAMVNLDTVGRLFDGPLTVFGANTAGELSHVLRGVNYGFGFALELPEKDLGASDQASFVRRGVPGMQVFTGPHADYHRPGDTADKIDYEGLSRVAEFTAELAIYLAERDEPMAFVPPGAEKAAAAAPPSGGSGRRVSFGSIPDFNYTGEGVRVSGVLPGSPAEKAGIKEGDLLVEFAGVTVEDLRSFSSILKGLTPGDEVDVVYVRGGERHTATVTVIERK
jgi:aminopeptidase N